MSAAPDSRITLSARRNGALNGSTGVTVHMKLAEEDLIPAAVPERVTLALLVVGLAGLGFSRRKQ